jgi:hypothetical protein
MLDRHVLHEQRAALGVFGSGAGAIAGGVSTFTGSGAGAAVTAGAGGSSFSFFARFAGGGTLTPSIAFFSSANELP